MANLFQAWDEDIQALGAAKASDDQIEARRQQLAEHFKAKAKAAGLSSKKIYETLDQFDAYSRQKTTAQDDQLTPEEQEMAQRVKDGTVGAGAMKEVGKRFKDVGLGVVSSLTRMGGDVAQTWADVGDNDKSELSSQIAQGLYNATDDIRSNYSEGTKQAKKDFWSPAGLTMGVSENLGQIAGSATVFGAAGKLAAARGLGKAATLATMGAVGAPLAYSQGYGQGKENSLDEINKTSNAQLWENVKAEAKAYDDAGGTGEVPYLVGMFKEAGGDLNLMKDLMAENAGNVTGLMTVATEPLAMGVGSLMSRGAAAGGKGLRAGLVNIMNNQGMSNELARRIAAGGSAGIASQAAKIAAVQGMRGTGQEGIQEGGEGYIAKTEGSLAAGRNGELTGEDWRGENGIIQQGLQGAAIGGIMAGGSVYSTARNASKLALEKNGLPEKHDAAIIAKEQADAALVQAANIADANPNNIDAQNAYAEAQDAALVATNDLEQLTGKFNALYTPEEQAVIKAATMEGVAARKKVADDAAKAQKELDDAQAKVVKEQEAQQAEIAKAQRENTVNKLASMVGDEAALNEELARLNLGLDEENALLVDAHKIAKKQKKAQQTQASSTATPKTPIESAVDMLFDANGKRNTTGAQDAADKHKVALPDLIIATSERIASNEEKAKQNSKKETIAKEQALNQKQKVADAKKSDLADKQQLENTLSDFAANNDHDSMVNFLRDYEPTEADKLIKNAYASVESKKKAEQDAIAATKKAEALKVKESEAKTQAEQEKIAFNQDMANLYAANPDRNPTKAELDSVGKKHGVKSPIELAQAWVKAKNEAKAAKEAAPKLALPSPETATKDERDITVPTGLNINRDNIENQDRRPIIVRNDGKPFPTQAQAEKALEVKSKKPRRRKEKPITKDTHEVIPVDGGFAIAPVVEIQQPKKPDDNEDGGVIADAPKPNAPKPNAPKPNAPVSPSGGTIPRVHLDRIGRLLKEGKTVEEIATKIQKSLPNLSIEYVTQQVLAAQEKASKPATLDSVIGKYSDDEEVDAEIRQSGEVLKQFLPETIDDWKIDKSTFAVRGAWSVSYTKPHIVTDRKTGKEVVSTTTSSAPLDSEILLSGDEQAIKDHIKMRLEKNGITPKGVKDWRLDDAVSPAGQQAVDNTPTQSIEGEYRHNKIESAKVTVVKTDKGYDVDWGDDVESFTGKNAQDKTLAILKTENYAKQGQEAAPIIRDDSQSVAPIQNKKDAVAAKNETKQPTKAEPAPVIDQFANNKIVTKDMMDAAIARIKAKMNRLNSGFDPELFTDGVIVAVGYIESGVHKFSDFAKTMIDGMGDNIKPYLLSFWEGARSYPNLNTSGMTDTVESKRQFDELNKTVAEKSTPSVIEPAPTTTAGKQISEAMDKTATAITEAAHNKVVERVRKGEEIVYKKPDAIERAKQDDRYQVEINDKGHAVVKNIKDSNGEWVKPQANVAPVTNSKYQNFNDFIEKIKPQLANKKLDAAWVIAGKKIKNELPIILEQVKPYLDGVDYEQAKGSAWKTPKVVGLPDLKIDASKRELNEDAFIFLIANELNKKGLLDFNAVRTTSAQTKVEQKTNPKPALEPVVPKPVSPIGGNSAPQTTPKNDAEQIRTIGSKEDGLIASKFREDLKSFLTKIDEIDVYENEPSDLHKFSTFLTNEILQKRAENQDDLKGFISKSLGLALDGSNYIGLEGAFNDRSRINAVEEFLYKKAKSTESLSFENKEKEYSKTEKEHSKSTGQQIASAMDKTAQAITDAAHSKVVERIKDGEEIVYKQPAAIERAKQDERYQVEINDKGYAVVKNIKDLNGEWVKKDEPIAAEATHIENGKAEEVTPEIIRESLAKVDDKPISGLTMSLKQGKQWLLDQVSTAIAVAPANKLDNKADDLIGLIKGLDTPKDRDKNKDKINAAKKELESYYVTFDVPNDGVFKVLNNVESLQKFKKKVEANRGFDKQSPKKVFPSVAQNSADTTIAEFLSDGEVENAYEFAKLQDRPIRFGVGNGQGRENANAYALTEPVDLGGGFKGFVGLSLDTTKKQWIFIEEKSRLSIGIGSKTEEGAIKDAKERLATVKDKSALLKSADDNKQLLTDAELEQQWLKQIGYNPNQNDDEVKADVKAKAEDKQNKAIGDEILNQDPEKATTKVVDEKPTGGIIKVEYPTATVLNGWQNSSRNVNELVRSFKRAYEDYINDAYNGALSQAETDAQKQVLERESLKLQKEYIKRVITLAKVRSGVTSSFIAGGSNFNNKQAQNRSNAFDKASRDFENWLLGNKYTLSTAVQEARSPEQLAAIKAEKDAKAQKLQDKNDAFLRKVLSFKKGDDFTIGKNKVVRVNVNKYGMPISLTLEGEGITKGLNDKISLYGRDMSYETVDDLKQNIERIKEADNAIADKAQPQQPALKKGEVGYKFSSGEVVLTATGRETTPFPKVDLSTNRKATNSLKVIESWLMDNAIAEAKARGDEFNLLQFNASRNKPQQADKDSAEMYLFDSRSVQPIPAPFMRQLVAGTTEPTPVTQPESKSTPVQDSANPFEEHNLIAKKYGYSVDDTGTIFTPKGKNTEVRVSKKSGRLEISNNKGVLFTSANPAEFGKFLESYWYAEKSKEIDSNAQAKDEAQPITNEPVSSVSKMQNAKAESYLSSKTSSEYGETSIKELIDNRIRDGWTLVSGWKEDKAAGKKLDDELAYLRRNAPIGNKNNPETQRLKELTDLTKGDTYRDGNFFIKEETNRLESPSGKLMALNKTAYEYAKTKAGQAAKPTPVTQPESKPTPTASTSSSDLTDEEYARLKKDYDDFKAKTDKIGAAKTREAALKVATDLVTEMPEKDEKIRRALSDAIRDNKWHGYEINFPKQPIKLSTDAELNQALKRLRKALEGTKYKIIGSFSDVFARLNFTHGESFSSQSRIRAIYKVNDKFIIGTDTYTNTLEYELLRPLVHATLNWLNGEDVGKVFIGEDFEWSAQKFGGLFAKKIDDSFKEAKAKGEAKQAESVAKKESEPTPVAEPTPVKEEAPKQEANSKTPTLDKHNALMDSVRDGKATAEDFKQSFADISANKDAILLELNALTKDQLLKEGGYAVQYRHKNDKKSEVAEAVYHSMIAEYSLGSGITYGMGKNSYENAVQKMVDNTDQQQLDEFAKEYKQMIDGRIEKLKAKAEALKNPTTLNDFRELMRSIMAEGKSRQEAFLSLSAEHRIKYDELEAESTKEARETRKRAAQANINTASQTTDGKIIETKHTRDGYDLFVVQLSDRLSTDDYKKVLSEAKKLGGWYSSYKGGGAIVGFQFKDKEAAQAFLALAGGDTIAAKEQLSQKQDDYADNRSQSAAERLLDMAEKIEAKANEELDRDRKANTARRARLAMSAENEARAKIALAKTMRNIAEAIKSGEAKFLDNIRMKVDVEALRAYITTAKDNEIRSEYDSYAEQVKRKGQPPTAATADFATYPTYTLFRSDLAFLGRQLLEIDGLKKLGQQIMAVADDVSDAYLDFARKNIGKVSRFQTKDSALAAFSSKELAERAIKRSGLTGKAIVLQVKRGENIVILSPSEAINLKVWEGDADKRITLKREFGNQLVEAVGRRAGKNNRLLPYQFQYAYDKLKALSRMGIETPSEFRSALREFIALQEEATNNKVREMEMAMVGRKKDGLDFFPTPQAIAQQMIDSAEITEDMAVLEPSAGMGHIADMIRATGAEPDVIEMSGDRRELLQEKGYHLAEVNDFMDMQPRTFFTFGDVFVAPDGKEGVMRGSSGQRVRLDDNEGKTIGYYNRDELTGVSHKGTDSGYDRIIMNPPFSNRQDAEHVRHAYELLRPNGRIVAIMGEGVFFGSDKKAVEFREWLESVGGTSEKLPDNSFMDSSLPVNTGVNARMVIIDKQDSDVQVNEDKPTQTEQEAQKPDAKFSRGTGEGLTTTQTRAILVKHFGEKVIKALESSGLLTIMATPPSWAEPDADGAYDKDSGKAYLFTDNLSAETVVATLAHELAGHKGFQEMMTPTAYASLMRQFNRLVNQGNAIALAAKARAEAAESTDGAQQDEMLPYLLTQQATLNATRTQQMSVKKLIEQAKRAVKAWLFNLLSKYGFDAKAARLSESFTPEDMIVLAERMIREMGNGTNPSNNTKAKGSQFSQLNTPQTQINAVRKKYEGTSQWMKAPNGQPTKLNEMQWLQVRTPNFKAWFGDWENDPKNASQVVDSNGEPMVVYHGTKSDFDVFNLNKLSKNTNNDGHYGAGIYFSVESLEAETYGNSVLPVFLSIKNPIKNSNSFLEPLAEKFGYKKEFKTVDKKWIALEISKKDANAGILAGLYADGYTVNNVWSEFEKLGGVYQGAIDLDEVGDLFENINESIGFYGKQFITENIGNIPEDKKIYGYSKELDILDITDRGNNGQWFTDIVKNVGFDGVFAGSEIIAFDPTQIKSAIGNTGEFNPTNPDIRFSRKAKNPITEGIKSAANDAKNSLPDPIAKSIDNFMAGRILPSSDMANITAKTELSIYKRTIGTQLNTALQLPDFKKVYDMAQRYLQHVAVDAYAALKVAPNLLGKLESWSDLKKDVKKIWPANFIKQKADRAAVASIIFDETLNNELLSDADILKALTRDQRQIYKEARDAIQVSLENTAKSEMVRKLLAAEAINWQTVESMINQDLPVEQFAQTVRDMVESRIGGFKNELEAILDADPKIKEAFKTGNKNKLIPAQKKDLKKAKTLKAQIDTTEEALKSLNDVENRLGTLIEQGYAPLMRFGEYTLTVRDLDGKVKSFFMFESKAEQVRATNAIVARYGKTVNLETDMISKEEFKQFAGMTPETMALFAKETGMDKDEAYQHYLKLAIPARSAMTRMIKRKGTEGFSDDIQRVVASFVMSNARMSAKNIYAAQIEKSIQDIESGKSVKDQAIVMKENVFNPKENFAQLRNFLFLWNLGGSLFFGLLNMTQPYMQTLPHLSQYVPIKDAFNAIIEGSGIAGSAMKNGTAPKGYEAEYNRAVREGVVDPQNVFMLSGVERGKTGASNSAWGVITHTMGLIAQVTESFNRKAVFIASLQVAKQKGNVWLKKKGFNSAYDFAKDTVDQTQGVYDKANRSNWANTSVGAPLMVFKQFSINYVEQMVRMWKKEAASGDEGKKAVFLMLAMLASLSGVMGLPFIKDILDVSETTAAFLGNPVNIEREARLALGKDLADPLFNGVLNHFVFNQFGVDVQSRTGMPDLVPWSNALNPTLSAQGRINEFASIAGATGGLIEKGYDATQLIARDEYGAAAKTLAPRFLTSWIDGSKMALTNEVMDRKGNKLFDTTWDEGLVKFIDANPKRMADLSRTKSLEWKDFAIQDYMTTSFKQKIINAMMDKDQAEVNKLMKEVEVWNNARSRYPVYIDLNTLAENANKKDQTFDAREKIRKGMTWVKNERPEM